MFREVLKFSLRMDDKDLSRMENTLNRRFRNVAKRFGSGLKGVLMGGGVTGAIAALGGGLILKVLNPLKETQEIIERTIGRIDDIGTMANKFSTDMTTMAKLVTLAQSTGLEESELFQLLNKFQTALVNFRADPSKPSAVGQFAGEKDVANAFFKFMQGMRKLDPNNRAAVERDVFGDRLSLKTADFFQTDLVAQSKKLFGDLGLASGDQAPGAKGVLESVFSKASGLVSQKKLLEARRNFEDLVNKSENINPGQLSAIDAGIRAEQARENERIKNFRQINEAGEALKRIEYSIEKMATTIVSTFPNLQATIISGINAVVNAAPKITSLMNQILGVLKGSRTIRGIRGDD
jgi:hypothetical protein